MTLSLFPELDVPNARILRRENPPPMRGEDGYREAKEYLRRDFANRCAYCMIHETDNGEAENFWIDHFQPRSKGGATNEYENLYWSCAKCNHIKHDKWPSPVESANGYRFADPCVEPDYGLHFVENSAGRIVPLTDCGEYHIDRLFLNRTSRLEHRINRNMEKRRLEELQDRLRTVLAKALSDTEEELCNMLLKEVERIEQHIRLMIPFIPQISS